MESIANLLTSLLLGTPRRLKDYERSLGPLDYHARPTREENLAPYYPDLPVKARELAIASLRFDFVFDVHHFDPRKDDNPHVGAMTLSFATPEARNEVLRFFSSGAGAQRTRVRGNTVHELERLYYQEETGELVCSSRRPDWAQLDWDENEIVRLTAAVRAILDEPSRKTLELLGGPLMDSGGQSRLKTQQFEFKYAPGAKNSPVVVLSFIRPFPLAGLLKALGLDALILYSGDFHGSSYHLADLNRKEPLYKGWRLLMFVEEDKITAESTDAFRGSNPTAVPIPLDRIFLTTLNAYRDGAD